MNSGSQRQWIAAAVLAIVMTASHTVRAQQSTDAYRIGSKDLLEIKVVELPDLNVERRVDDHGTIDLPLLGALNVEGMTAPGIAKQLDDLLRAKYVNRATVSVTVKEFASKPISVMGAVGKPGALNVSSRMTLLQAIAGAGGLAPTSGKKIYVLRRADNGLSDVLEVNIDQLLRDANPIWNVPLYPSDVVNVPSRTSIKVFCLGEVKNPGAIEFDSDDRITLLTVIAKAGGFTDRASKTIRIKRKSTDGKDVESTVNYKAVLSGQVNDPILKPDDVVVVEESFF